MSGWKEYKLGQIVETLDNQRIPLSSMERAQRKGIYRYYGAQGVIDYIDSYIFDGKYMLVAEDGNNIKERKENIALIAEGKYWVNNHAHILKSNGKCDLDLVCYIINQMDISGFVTGTAQPKLNQANLMKLPLYLPDLPTQQRIASILSSLDAKIENNNKINAKLEEIAQNLFKEWFVDFGPFKNGKFVESELGLIPEGWRVVKLESIIKDIAAGPFGSNLPTSCFTESGFPIIDGANLKELILTDNITKFVTEEKARSLKRSIAKKGDLIVTISGNVGQVSYIPQDSKYDEYLVSQRQFRCTFDEEKIKLPYIAHFFHQKEGQNSILAFVNQTGVPALSQPLKNFRSISLVLPPIDIQEKICAILLDIDNKIVQLRKESTKLASLRDTLLPKLMSGEIEV